ncbi:MAG: ferritin-like domain-containing protein [Chloroflexota bacterium]|nr:ferritin-like domain-containing protein [Chloroflexota bacterium]
MRPTITNPYHESLTNALTQAQAHRSSRRTALRTSLVATGAAAITLTGSSVFGFRSAMAQTFAGPVDVLNYALTLEHLEATFYREFNDEFSGMDIESAGFGSNVRGRLESIEAHEAEHVDVLVSVIDSLGGTPVTEAMYNFGVTDVDSYIATAQVLENLGTGAYTGAAQFLIDNDDLLTAALTIHGVEARHASYLNVLNDDSPFPEAFETALSPEEVLAAAGPLIVSDMPDTGAGPGAGTDGPGMGTYAALGALGLGAAALAVRTRESRTPNQAVAIKA